MEENIVGKGNFCGIEGNLNSFDSLPPELKALLTEMQALDPPHTIDPTMTITNFREGMEKVPEGKSSLLSGHNYSIYKAMLPDKYFTRKVIELINKGVTHGFVLKCWRKVLQVMLCKTWKLQHQQTLRHPTHRSRP